MKYALYLVLSICFTSCFHKDIAVGPAMDFSIFENTPVAPLAKEIYNNNNSKLNNLLATGSFRHIINYQEQKYGNTLLMLAVFSKKKYAVKLLLQYGADPNLFNDSIRNRGENAVIIASESSTAEILELLLKNGGNPNSCYCGKEQDNLGDLYSIRYSALIEASKDNLSKVKLLIEYGADINYYDVNNPITALQAALIQEKMDIVLFLLKCGADYTIPYIVTNVDGTKDYYDICYLLRCCVFPLKSDKFNLKQKVIQFLQEQGVNYNKSQIPEKIKISVRDKYPDTWEYYLKHY